MVSFTGADGTRQTLSAKFCDEPDRDMCQTLKATAKSQGWEHLDCIETRCASNLCNGLKCFQPEPECLKNISDNALGPATLKKLAACRPTSRQCDMLDASACVNIEIRTSSDTLLISGCHVKGSETLCHRVLAHHTGEEVNCREKFCVTDNCNHPLSAGISFAVLVGILFGIGILAFLILAARLFCCLNTNRPGQNDHRCNKWCNCCTCCKCCDNRMMNTNNKNQNNRSIWWPGRITNGLWTSLRKSHSLLNENSFTGNSLNFSTGDCKEESLVSLTRGCSEEDVSGFD